MNTLFPPEPLIAEEHAVSSILPLLLLHDTVDVRPAPVCSWRGILLHDHADPGPAAACPYDIPIVSKDGDDPFSYERGHNIKWVYYDDPMRNKGLLDLARAVPPPLLYNPPE